MFLSSTPPSSQKAGDRPISFILTDNTVSPPESNTLEMIIRPEELTRTDASRMTVQQTLGGAWVDSFGPGLATINISGTTGWRGNPVTGSDGMDEFAALKEQTYTDWHRRRNAAVQAGMDPAQVTLVFADALDAQIDVVVPINFTLRRSKSRPLLMQFNIAMVAILGDAGSFIYPSSDDSVSNASSSLLALSSLVGSINAITSAITGAVAFVQSAILRPVVSFMQTTLALVNAASSLVATAASIPASLMATAQAVVQAGMTMFSMIAAIPGMATSQISAAMSVASAYSNIFCLLGNAINQQQTYPDYTPLFGASNCSSTVGGSPVSAYIDTNPFYAVMGAAQSVLATPAVTVTPAAQQALALVNNADPVLAPMTPTGIGAAASTISSGITLP